MRTLTLTLATALLLAATPSWAYVGPGLGAGTLATVIGFIGSVFLALFAIIWFPIKRLIKRIRGDSGQQSQAAERSESRDSEDSAQQPQAAGPNRGTEEGNKLQQ